MRLRSSRSPARPVNPRAARRRARERYRAEPPPPAAGEVVGPPDYVGIGLQRCGTTWANWVLGQHPEIHAPAGRPKELRFWMHLEGPPSAAEIERYGRCFPRPAGMKAGEWSPGYLVNPHVAPALVVAAPAARFLVTVRDPVDRYWSDVHRRLHGGSDSVPVRFVTRSLYLDLLGAALEHLPREQLLVVQLERARTDAAEVARSMYRFVGVEPDFRPEGVGQRRNEARGGEKVPLDERERAFLAEAFASQMEGLARMFPEVDLDLWPSWRAVAGA